MTAIAIVGLGIMGSAMAHNLLGSGHDVSGTDVSPERRDELTAAGGRATTTVTAAISGVDAVITSLPSPEAALAVSEELSRAGHEGLVVVETSTLSPQTKQDCHDILARANIVMLDCPLSGTGAQARERDLVVLGSGDEAAFEAVRPALEAIARSVRHLGPFGNGTITKLVANLLVSIHNASTAEAFALGVRAGLDPQQLYDTVREGAGGSVIFDKRGPLMIDRTYLPATARVSMFLKDVALVQELASSVGVQTPVLDATLPLYEAAAAAGHGDEDAAALLEVLDRRSSR
jgi:putative dehydrogenase